MSSPILHATGYRPDRAALAGEAVAAASAGRYRAPLFAADDRPLPDAFSLSALRIAKMLQYGFGTCWVHAPKRIKELMDAAGGYEPEEVSRAMIAYQGERLMARLSGGRPGNPSDGGSVAQAFLAMAGDDEGGIGVCREAAWPYVPADVAERSQYAGFDGDRARAEGCRYLMQAPPAGALDGGKASRVHQVVDLPIGDGTPWKRSIFNGHGVGIGIWWTAYWDTQGATFFDRIGSGEYGHALAVIGYLVRNGVLYWQLDNWHGELYAPLDAATAKAVAGYKPTSPGRTTDFWVSDAILRRVIGFGNAEHVVAATSTGFRVKDPLAGIKKGLGF